MHLTTLNTIALALTAIERFDALRKLSRNVTDDRWFILAGVIAISILTVLFFATSYKRIKEERKISEKLFIEYAEKRGLTVQERQTLLEIASKAELKQNESIFTLSSAFDTGTDKIKKKLVGRQSIQENKQMESVLLSLREKLGFKKEASLPTGQSARPERLTSRQIPVGKEIQLIRQGTQDSEAVGATVIKNDDMELAVKLAGAVTITFGEYWKVRYYFSSSIWEFDSYVLSYDGNIMVLSHSDNVRFINRRRFLRAPVQKPAFIALFPFERKLKSSLVESTTETGETAQEFPDFSLKPLQFAPAIVTELGGPGLRIEAPIEAKVGDRVLIIFELDREKERNVIKDPQTDEVTEVAHTVLRIAEDIGVVEEIGEVRRTEQTPKSFSIAVELTGLRDSDVDSLIRATNAASLNVTDDKNVPMSV